MLRPALTYIWLIGLGWLAGDALGNESNHLLDGQQPGFLFTCGLVVVGFCAVYDVCTWNRERWPGLRHLLSAALLGGGALAVQFVWETLPRWQLAVIIALLAGAAIGLASRRRAAKRPADDELLR